MNIKRTILATLSGCLLTVLACKANDPRPNIVWIIPDDMSAHFGCYGETSIQTPHLDRLAARGVRFTNAYVTAPVCSTSRSAFITGMYQTSIGAHHHRSGRGKEKIYLPEGVKLVPQLFQDAGYYTSIQGWRDRRKRFGKTDYNFEWDKSIYDGIDWFGRKPGQPFFAQIQTRGGKLRGEHPNDWDRIAQWADEELGSHTAVSDVTLPLYYPNHPDILRDWAAYLDSVRLTDAMVGDVLKLLEDRGELENTLVLFMTDHGISHARGKQFLYDEGLHVPLVIAGPGIEVGTVRDDLVEHIDIAALSLAAAGIEIPAAMQAKDILAEGYTQRSEVYSARDRCDETVDHIRSVRTDKFKYIRNYLPGRPLLQPNVYKDSKAILIALREAHAKGNLTPEQAILFEQTRAPEELFDMKNDPFELNNLADNPEYAAQLKELRGQLENWESESEDAGRVPEDPKLYASEMNDQLVKMKEKNSQSVHVFESNVRLMNTWAAEGK